MNTITRYISLVVLAVAFVIASAVPASATTMSIQSVVIPNYRVALNPGETLYLVIYADRPFISSAGIPIQAGSPANGRWYKRVTCTVVGTDVTIPTFTLDSTTDAQDIPGKAARYSAYFYANTRNLGQYGGFESFRVLPVYANPTPTDATWAQIRADNTAGAAMSIDRTTLTSEQINRLINEAVLLSGGLTSVDGLTGPALTFVDHTNITITPSGTTLTVGVTGQFAVGIGGTGSGTAAGARTNLGAAASGANSDITSVSGLTTPLSGPQGGTGFASYTVGDLLYASTSSALSKLAAPASGQVLVSAGTGTAPAWSASPTLTAVTSTNLFVTGLTTGRVLYVGASDQILDEANFLWDASNDRLSLGLTDSTNTVNLPNGGWISGRGTVAAAQIRALAVTDKTRFTGAATSETVDAITLGDGGRVAHVMTEVGATALNPLAPDYQVRTGGIKVGFGTAGAYNDSASSNVFHFSSYVSSIGTAPVVAGFFEAAQLGAGGQAWALNPVAYTSLNAGAGSSIGMEMNVGALGTSASQAAYGIVIAINAGAFTPTGTIPSLIQFQRVLGGAALPGAIATNGIVWNNADGEPVSGALLHAQGITATTAANFTGSTFSSGIDLATSTFSSGNQIRLANGGGASSGITAYSTTLANVAMLRLSSGNFIEIGDGDTTDGLAGLRFLVGATTAETLRMVAGTAGLPGNIGLNQGTTSAQVHQTAIVKRALTADLNTFSIMNGSPNLTATNAAFTTELAPGSSIEISAQAGTVYTVLSITDDDNLVLTIPYTGSTTTTSNGKSDYRTWLVENGATAGGDDWAYLDDRHTMVLRGNSIYGDERGMLKLEAREDANKKLLFGVDNTGSYSYITSINSFTAYMPLLLNGGAGSGNTGAVLIGTPTASLVGALLKVEGAGAKTANHVATEFNNIATSVNVFQKISAQYLTSGSWIGPNYGLFSSATGAVSTTSSGTADRWNIPLGAYGGSVVIGPAAAQVTTPAPVGNIPTATLDVYAFAAENATDAADETAETTASINVNGTNTEWNTPGNDDYIRPGDAVMFGSEGTVAYQVSSVTSDTALVLTGATAGSITGTEMYQDPVLLKLRNGFGTERLRVESSGFTKLTGTFVGLQSTIASAAALPLSNGNVFLVTGSTNVTSVSFFNLATDTSQTGRIVTLVWDTGATFDVISSAALQLEGGTDITAYTAGDTLTILNIDGTNWVAVAQSDNAP